MKMKWNGVFPAVTTKFNLDDSLNLQMFENNLNAQINARVDGIILGGTLGEASTLEMHEKRILLKETIRISNGQVPIVINIAEQSTKAAVLSARQAEEDGANGLMLLPPLRYLADERETVTFLKTVANSTELPVMIYNNPVDYKIEVTADMFAKLADCENIQAIKESTRDITNITRMKNRFGNRFKILSGVDTLALESLIMGADGWVAGLVCAFPCETVAIYRLVKEGRFVEARTIFRWFLPLLELDINAKLVQNIKLAEVATGIGTEHVRAPRLPLEGNERKEVLSIISRGITTRPLLEKYFQKPVLNN